jgi:hypothetical protein
LAEEEEVVARLLVDKVQEAAVEVVQVAPGLMLADRLLQVLLAEVAVLRAVLQIVVDQDSVVVFT